MALCCITSVITLSYLAMVNARIGLIIPNNFESYQLICPEISPFPCAASDVERIIEQQYEVANHRVYEGYIGCESAKIAMLSISNFQINQN